MYVYRMYVIVIVIVNLGSADPNLYVEFLLFTHRIWALLIIKYFRVIYLLVSVLITELRPRMYSIKV